MDEDIVKEEEEEEEQPDAPASFYINRDKYKMGCKIVTRCSLFKVVNVLEKTLGEFEMEWFREQNQFSHLFHMPREPNRKSMGMWLLVLRTARLKKRNVWWFVVNVVPVRYSLWEHGLISGLDCSEYLPNYKGLESLKFAERCFGKDANVTLKDIEKKITSMIACEDRLRMVVLYFLGSGLISNTKADAAIDTFLLRIVNNLDQ
ncbi:hypothetical protein V5N11_034279 [Cardamine amara subsp. amara]|uniref:DUF1985 domain-containing protein n=1 Tax=Cardamine amara subsp. amara TaxID=228776 RepID=A0ABD1ACE4_CARAN